MNAISGTRREIKEMAERFNAKWIFNRMNGCHEWTACITPNGYGAIQFNGEKVPAHRISWVINRGEITNGLHVLHKCDNRRCVNPEHLFLGTHQDNMRDRNEKGREAHPPHGDENWLSKLRGEKREQAKAEWMSGEPDGITIAKKYGMSIAGMRKAFGCRGRKRGIKNKRAKLTLTDVSGIRAKLQRGQTIASIAREHGVAWPQIKRIKTGEGWRNV